MIGNNFGGVSEVIQAKEIGRLLIDYVPIRQGRQAAAIHQP